MENKEQIVRLLLKKRALAKAISDIRMGDEVEEKADRRYQIKHYDYNHLLPDEFKSMGYGLALKHQSFGDGHYLEAELTHNREHVGHLSADINGRYIEPMVAEIKNPDHRGKGLGFYMYEALFAHARGKCGATHVSGGVHSTMASKVHQKLARVHGMEYEAIPFTGENAPDPGTPSGPFDDKFAPYKYALDPMKKYEPPYGVDQLGPKTKDCPIHRWRAETGIELIHKEPDAQELDRIWTNWQTMPDSMKAQSDAKSKELFGMTNEEHYNIIRPTYKSEDDNCDEIDWEAAPSGPFDDKFAPYKYALDPMEKAEGMFRSAAFRHRVQGHIVETGRYHNIEPWLIGGSRHGQFASSPAESSDWEAGFVTKEGQFMNREEAGRAAGTQRWSPITGKPDNRLDSSNIESGLGVDGFGKSEDDNCDEIDWDELEKGLPALFLAAAIGAGTPQPTQMPPHPTSHVQNVWTPAGLHHELHPIAHLESSFGKNTKHFESKEGSWDTAVGAVGLKPMTAHEEYLRRPELRKKFPGLESPVEFEAKFKMHHGLYNAVASEHWKYLRKHAGSPEKAAFAWRFGLGAAKRATPEQIKGAEYVQKYLAMLKPMVTFRKDEEDGEST